MCGYLLWKCVPRLVAPLLATTPPIESRAQGRFRAAYDPALPGLHDRYASFDPKGSRGENVRQALLSIMDERAGSASPVPPAFAVACAGRGCARRRADRRAFVSGAQKCSSRFLERSGRVADIARPGVETAQADETLHFHQSILDLPSERRRGHQLGDRIVRAAGPACHVR